MTIGKETIDWLFKEQLKVDAKWSMRVPSGFIWWPYQHAQTIKIAGEEVGPDGEIAYLISIRTDVLQSLELDDRAVSLIGASIMPFASMAGVVYDAVHRTLNLCSLVRVHAGIAKWMRPIISVAAILQINEAQSMAVGLAQAMNATAATSAHPTNGNRPEPDEMAQLVPGLVKPIGREPCKWQAEEFQDAVDDYMQGPPSLMANGGGLGFTVEFPYGGFSSLCQAKGDQPHSIYGNGLFVRQVFPVRGYSDIQGARLAMSLNESELVTRPSGYGFGSYVFRDNAVSFVSFYPNAMYRPGLLPNIYYSCAQRAQAMSESLANSEWTKDSFDSGQTAMGHVLKRARGNT